MGAGRLLAAGSVSLVFDDLIFVEDGHVSTIILNRPEVTNKLSRRLLAELHQAVDHVNGSVDCSVLVITGAGGNFCGGDDLAEDVVRGRTGQLVASEPLGPCRDLAQKLEDLDQVTVCAVDGRCVGGGFDIAMACDFVICTEGSECGAFQPAKVGLDVGPFNKVVPKASLSAETVRLVGRVLSSASEFGRHSA